MDAQNTEPNAKPNPVVRIITEESAGLCELHIQRALELGFKLRSFNVICDGQASPTYVALMIKTKQAQS
jgi:hypothetical protein